MLSCYREREWLRFFFFVILLEKGKIAVEVVDSLTMNSVIYPKSASHAPEPIASGITLNVE